ncbi:hypothetical protein [Thiohalobacter thiocyanaticus]|uniref:Uncharacterized protein n=1 Tax=Thiohalobacter thiocyanaticus TaxID=585455 RepID=A0A426QGQ3_9GAMM|nr:hypothetical protein [Thiohalobacter thiocyanaticus]RRQ20926.1 hypothetical protein D6C00_02380 [Thiohalobacter thiocyanaticus]
MPAKAGTHVSEYLWIPAFAGMTKEVTRACPDQCQARSATAMTYKFSVLSVYSVALFSMVLPPLF